MNKVLVNKYPWLCGLVMIMITASLYFNILALTTPFLTIYRFIGSNDVYSLFGAVKMMWGYNLYIIAILIVGFSIIFPFVKLIALFYICFIIKESKARYRTIRIIESFAKWSMLDIFVVCILLVLTNNQIFVSSKPEIGVYYFLLAIFISIICAILVDHLCEQTYPVSSKRIDARRRFISEKFSVLEKALMIILQLVSIVFFVFAITDNYIQISDFFLIENSYSIFQTCLSLKPISLILAWFVAFVLIICPIIYFNYLFIFWTTPYYPVFHIRIMKVIRKLYQFMMLDVFCLALILFLMESNIIIGTESRAGLYMLVSFVFMSFFFPVFVGLYEGIRFFMYTKKKNSLGPPQGDETNSKV